MGTNNKRETTETTPLQFRDLAERMAQIAESYNAIADAMDRRKITHLDVLGMDTLENVTLPRLSGALASANRALTSYKKPAESSRSSVYRVAEDPEKLRISGDAEKANRTTAARKKKKTD